jgi:hypothetical protein
MDGPRNGKGSFHATSPNVKTNPSAKGAHHYREGAHIMASYPGLAHTKAPASRRQRILSLLCRLVSCDRRDSCPHVPMLISGIRESVLFQRVVARVSSLSRLQAPRLAASRTPALATLPARTSSISYRSSSPASTPARSGIIQYSAFARLSLLALDTCLLLSRQKHFSAP